jgi:predicted nuclease of predicted toxin-antitoxin system
MSPNSEWSFLVDENTSRSLIPALRSAGYKAEHIYDAGLQGHPDSEVYAYAQSHRQTIITIDLDFSNSIHYSPPHSGIIVIRLPNRTPVSDLIQEVLKGLKTLDGQSLADTIVIVESGRIRVRRWEIRP